MSRRASSRSISTPACAARTTQTLSEATIAERAAELCAAAEDAAGGADLAYVIGTEVPIPGGETEALDALAVTPR